MDPRVLALLDDWLMRVSQFAREIVHTDSTYQATHWSELLGMYQQFKKEVLASAISNGVDMDSVEVALLLGSLSRRYVEQMLQVKESFELLNTPLEREPGSQQQASGTTDGSESPVAPAAQDQTPATQPVLNPDGSSRH